MARVSSARSDRSGLEPTDVPVPRIQRATPRSPQSCWTWPPGCRLFHRGSRPESTSQGQMSGRQPGVNVQRHSTGAARPARPTFTNCCTSRSAGSNTTGYGLHHCDRPRSLPLEGRERRARIESWSVIVTTSLDATHRCRLAISSSGRADINLPQSAGYPELPDMAFRECVSPAPSRASTTPRYFWRRRRVGRVSRVADVAGSWCNRTGPSDVTSWVPSAHGRRLLIWKHLMMAVHARVRHKTDFWARAAALARRRMRPCNGVGAPLGVGIASRVQRATSRSCGSVDHSGRPMESVCLLPEPEQVPESPTRFEPDRGRAFCWDGRRA